MPLMHIPVHSVIGSGPPVQQRSPAQSEGPAHRISAMSAVIDPSGQSPSAVSAMHSPRRFFRS
jgi:hypothetical protein